MSALGGRVRDIAAEELRANGVEVLFGERVAGFEGDGRGRVARVLTESGRVVEADIVSIGVGVRPEVALARSAGLEIGETGAVVTDERQRTSASGVYAAGDCCEVLNRVSGRKVWHPLGHLPCVRVGSRARTPRAKTLPRRRATRASSARTPSSSSGLSWRARASRSKRRSRLASTPSETESESHTRAGYYPGGSKIHTRLVADRRGRLLGAQLVGREGVAQRVNVYAAALHAGLRVEELERLDLAYAPPFAPTIDPIIRAAHKASKKD